MDVDSERVEELASGQAVRPNSRRRSGCSSASTIDVDLQEALDALPDAFRQAVWLRDVEEFTYAEIAEMLDVPIGTVMSRIPGRRSLFEVCRRPAAAQVGAAQGRLNRTSRAACRDEHECRQSSPSS